MHQYPIDKQKNNLHKKVHAFSLNNKTTDNLLYSNKSINSISKYKKNSNVSIQFMRLAKVAFNHVTNRQVLRFLNVKKIINLGYNISNRVI